MAASRSRTENIELRPIPCDAESLLTPPHQHPPWYKTLLAALSKLRLQEIILSQDGQVRQRFGRSNASSVRTESASAQWFGAWRERLVRLSSTPLQATSTHDFNTSTAAEAKRELMQAVTDNGVDSMIFSWLCPWYTAHLEFKIRENWRALFCPVLVGINLENESPSEDDLSRAFTFITAVISKYKTDGLNLMDLCDVVDNDHFLRPDNSDVERIALAQLVFSIVGWTSFLYSPKSRPDPEYLRIINPSSESWTPTTFSRKSPLRNKSKTFNSFKQALDSKDQPLFVLLNMFGEVVPKHHREHIAGHEASSVIPKPDGWIEVSILCYQTLNKFASIEIEWVDNLALHLEFDSSKKKLNLFQFPSACLILGSSSETSVLAQLLLDYSISNEIPRTEAVEYFKEVILSYRLIFGQDKGSYQAFNKQTKKQHGSPNGTEILRNVPDPLLSKICGSNWNSDGVKDLWDEIGADYPAPRYNPNNDFPFLGKRLLELQTYVRAQHPNTIKALWNDRRNLSWWWTFWAVIIIGGATLVLGFVQVALQVLQLIFDQQGANSVHGGLR